MSTQPHKPPRTIEEYEAHYNRPAPRCSIEGCEALMFCRSMCQSHYRRWYRHGDPLAVKPRPPRAPKDWRPRWDAKVTVKRNGCHEWEGLYIRGIPVFLAPNDMGDDRSKKHRVMAHRFIFLVANPGTKDFGPRDRLIRECGNGKCVNPAHMRTVTYKDVEEAKQAALLRRRLHDRAFRERMRQEVWEDERLPA